MLPILVNHFPYILHNPPIKGDFSYYRLKDSLHNNQINTYDGGNTIVCGNGNGKGNNNGKHHGNDHGNGGNSNDNGLGKNILSKISLINCVEHIVR